MNKTHIYFVSESIPHQSFGSFVIFFRHLIEFHRQGYLITLIIPDYAHINTDDYTKDYPKEWTVIKIPARYWYFLPYRSEIALLREIRYIQLYRLIKDRITVRDNDIILTYFYMQYLNGFACWLKRKFNCKLAIFLHDDKYLLTDYNRSSLKHDQKLVKDADKVLTVTNELSIPETDCKKYLQLFPIPEGKLYPPSPQIDKICIGFAGTLYSDYADIFDAILTALKVIDGEMHLIANKNEHSWLTMLLTKHENLILIPCFIYNTDALKYLKDNCNLLYCGYPLEATNMKWTSTSFPSKLLEYTFLNIPIILSAPKNTSLHNWMLAVSWPLQINSVTEIAQTFNSFLAHQDMYVEFLKDMQQKVFNPQLIHQRILDHV